MDAWRRLAYKTPGMVRDLSRGSAVRSRARGTARPRPAVPGYVRPRERQGRAGMFRSGLTQGTDREVEAGTARLPRRAEQRAARPPGRAPAAPRRPRAPTLRARLRQPGPLPRWPHACDLRRAPQESVPPRRPDCGRPSCSTASCATPGKSRRKEAPRLTLVIEPFEPLSAKDRDALDEEGERLLRFVAEDTGALDPRFRERSGGTT